MELCPPSSQDDCSVGPNLKLTQFPEGVLTLIVGHVTLSFDHVYDPEYPSNYEVKFGEQQMAETRRSPYVWSKEQFLLAQALSMSCKLMNRVVRNSVEGFRNVKFVYNLKLRDLEPNVCVFPGCYEEFETPEEKYAHQDSHVIGEIMTEDWLLYNWAGPRHFECDNREMYWEQRSMPLKVALSYPKVKTLIRCIGPALGAYTKASANVECLGLIDDNCVETLSDNVEQVRSLDSACKKLIYIGIHLDTFLRTLELLSADASRSVQELHIYGIFVQPSVLLELVRLCPLITKLTFNIPIYKTKDSYIPMTERIYVDGNVLSEEWRLDFESLKTTKLKALGIGHLSVDDHVIPEASPRHTGPCQGLKYMNLVELHLEDFDYVIHKKEQVCDLRKYLLKDCVKRVSLTISYLLMEKVEDVQFLKEKLYFSCIKVVRILISKYTNNEYLPMLHSLKLAPCANTELVVDAFAM